MVAQTIRCVQPFRLGEDGRRASELFSKRGCLKTGSKALDALLRGGVSYGALTDFFGPSSSGKTQICHQLCLEIAKEGGLAYYLDATQGFRPERLVEMAEHRGHDPKTILERINVAKVHSWEQQLRLAEEALAKRVEGPRLLIIDGVTEALGLDYPLEKIIAKQMALAGHLLRLGELALESGAAIVITNGVRQSLTSSQLVERGGNALLQGIHFRIFLSREGDRFRALLVQPKLASQIAYFRIGSEGLRDE